MLNRTPRGLFLRVLLLLSLAAAPAGAAPTWRPITEEDRTIETRGLDTSAGAIVLLREISVDDSDDVGTVLDYYIRTKVLSAKGVESMDKVEIPFTRGRSIRDLAARVVKADGTVVEVDRKSFYTREVVRVGKEAVSVKAFSFPGLEPGCIAEYRYRVRASDAVGGLRLDLDDTYPVALVRIRVRPYAFPGLSMQVLWTRTGNITARGQDKRNFHVFEGTNIPVTPEEPLSPPDEVIRPWFAFYFTFGKTEDYWAYQGGELAAIVKEYLKPNKQLARAAEKITAGATTDEAKIALLYEYCRTQIKNLSYDACGYTPEEIEDLKPNRKPIDVLTNGYGTDLDINLLFAALLRALKAECHLAYCGDRSRGFFNKKQTMRSALPDLLVALRTGSWRFYDPGALYVPLGRLKWRNEGTTALVVDEKYYDFIDTPDSKVDYSRVRRVADVRLDAGGTLEGTVELTYAGHEATSAKHLHDGKTADESLALVREEFDPRLGPVEITDFAVRDATDPAKPVTIAFHLRVPGYAEVVGDRLFVQPALFQKNAPARLTATTRTFEVYFPYPTSEEDVVTIGLPPGFEYEVQSVPRSISGDDAFNYTARIHHHADLNRIVYTRALTLDMLLVKVTAYGWLKECFDRMHKQDAHTITLARAAAPSPAPPADPAPAGETAAAE